MTAAVQVVRLGRTEPDCVFRAIGQIHADTIHDGALSLLGQGFLARLYRAVARAPRAGVWGAMEDGEVVGFLAGCADVRACYRSVVARAGFPLAWRAVPALRSPRVWRKVVAVCLYPYSGHGSPNDSPDRVSAGRSEILAIAVRADWGRKGIGGTLIRAFEESLVHWGVAGRYRVTTNLAETDANRFYQRAGFAPARRFRHHDLVLQEYVKQVPTTRYGFTARSGRGATS